MAASIRSTFPTSCFLSCQTAHQLQIKTIALPHAMKFSSASIFAAALVAVATAAPTAPITVSPAHALLAKRADTCWAQNINDTTTATSPLVTDCQVLSESSLPGPWIPSEETNYTFDIRHGTCGFKVVFNPSGSSLEASDMVIHPAQISGVIEHAIEHMAANGRVAATGAFACMIAGWKPLLGWASWEIYEAE